MTGTDERSLRAAVAHITAEITIHDILERMAELVCLLPVEYQEQAADHVRECVEEYLSRTTTTFS